MPGVGGAVSAVPCPVRAAAVARARSPTAFNTPSIRNPSSGNAALSCLEIDSLPADAGADDLGRRVRNLARKALRRPIRHRCIRRSQDRHLPARGYRLLVHGAGPALPHVWRLRRRCRRRMVPEVRRRWRGRPLGSHRIEAANMARSAPFNGLGCLAAGQRLMPQHEQLHLLGGSGAAQQQDQPKHLPGDHLSHRSDTPVIVPGAGAQPSAAGGPA